MKALFVSAAIALALLAGQPALAAGDGEAPPSIKWSFNGLFGTFDRAAQQRGFQVYTEVCASCHAMRLIYYRHLSGIGLSEAQIKAAAAAVEVTDGPDAEGEMFERPGRASDRFMAPFANANAARAANGGAFPPDLSLMTKARLGGADYVNGILTGYSEPPSGVQVPDGMSYNKFFPGHQIAMPAPLSDDAVEYADGTKATVPQMAKDVTTFLAWAAEPELEERKRMGVKVVLFLILLTGMMFAVKRKIWADIH